MRSSRASIAICRTCRLAMSQADSHQPCISTRRFHSLPLRRAQRRSPYRSITQAEIQRIADARASLVRDKYTEADKDMLKQHYTPEQMEAIEAAEEAVDPSDLSQARARNDYFAETMNDPDGFARVLPVVDRKLSFMRGEWDNVTPESLHRARTMKTENDATKEEWDVFGQELKAEGERALHQEMNTGYVPEGLGIEREDENGKKVPLGLASYQPLDHRQKVAAADFSGPEVAHELPLIQDPSITWQDTSDATAEDDDTELAYERLSRALGQPAAQLRRYRFKIIVNHRVVNQTRLGKIASQYYLCVAGDENGMLGIGEGKAAENDEAMRMARLNAIRHLRPVARYEKRTIFGEVQGKSGAVEVTLSARPPGFGLRCSQHIYEIAKCAGLSDLSAKVHRARNPMNVAKAVWKALCEEQRDPEEIARARGRKLVDVRKVYYAGLV